MGKEERLKWKLGCRKSAESAAGRRQEEAEEENAVWMQQAAERRRCCRGGDCGKVTQTRRKVRKFHRKQQLRFCRSLHTHRATARLGPKCTRDTDAPDRPEQTLPPLWSSGIAPRLRMPRNSDTTHPKVTNKAEKRAEHRVNDELVNEEEARLNSTAWMQSTSSAENIPCRVA
ncbi:hypothetical protein WMY93_034223 [Mugilogobius chulae]|uniref:Uncharacterized protein n=1 Tax=Mugilogobius chulae TaxID=88201 RepID=A0AAW0MF36_9GOBI